MYLEGIGNVDQHLPMTCSNPRHSYLSSPTYSTCNISLGANIPASPIVEKETKKTKPRDGFCHVDIATCIPLQDSEKDIDPSPPDSRAWGLSHLYYHSSTTI